MKYIVTIGLETHVQLKTRTKMFCSCANTSSTGDTIPNTAVCPVCLGLPGALPVANREAVRLTVLSGMMLGCKINPRATFDRKNYFYPDMAKNFQISENEAPLCLGGFVELPGGEKSIRINHIHLEEDAAKISHHARTSGIDYNRCGTPLMEIVSEPDIASPDEAMEYLQTLKQILVYAGVSDCNLEEGNMRSDVNISLRPLGQEKLGTKVEIKNMNTFKGIHAALECEIRRQSEILDAGGTIIQETRRFDAESGETHSMRTKENAHDYRYFPEPDLLPIALEEATLDAWRATLPELPAARKTRFVGDYKLPEYDAGVLTAARETADFFESVVKIGVPPKMAANWTMTEILRLETLPDPAQLAELLLLVANGTINQTTAKELLPEVLSGISANKLVAERGLAQVGDDGALSKWVDEVLAANPKVVDDFKNGKKAAAGFLVGQVMKLSRGKADAKKVNALLAEKLS